MSYSFVTHWNHYCFGLPQNVFSTILMKASNLQTQKTRKAAFLTMFFGVQLDLNYVLFFCNTLKSLLFFVCRKDGTVTCWNC